MTTQLPRFTRELNMSVVRMTRTEMAAAQTRFDELVAQYEKDGKINAGNYPYIHAGLWRDTHYGADAAMEVADDVALEPLPESK
jgi:hypothetical protein